MTNVFQIDEIELYTLSKSADIILVAFSKDKSSIQILTADDLRHGEATLVLLPNQTDFNKLIKTFVEDNWTVIQEGQSYIAFSVKNFKNIKGANPNNLRWEFCVNYRSIVPFLKIHIFKETINCNLSNPEFKILSCEIESLKKAYYRMLREVTKILNGFSNQLENMSSEERLLFELDED